MWPSISVKSGLQDHAPGKLLWRRGGHETDVLEGEVLKTVDVSYSNLNPKHVVL